MQDALAAAGLLPGAKAPAPTALMSRSKNPFPVREKGGLRPWVRAVGEKV